MEGDVLHMMSPYQERTPGGAPSEKVVSDQTSINIREPGMKRAVQKKVVHAPRALYYQAQVVLSGEFDSFLDVLCSSRVDSDHWHAPLLTRNPERGVEVAALDRPVGECVRLVVGKFGGARLIRTPGTVGPASDDVSAVSCGRVIARGGRWDGVDQWLRNFGCEDLELGVGWPTL